MITLAPWSPTEQWEYVLRLQVDKLALGILLGAGLLTLVLQPKRALLFASLAALSFAAIALAGDLVVFFAGFVGLQLLALAYAPRATQTDGRPLLVNRWIFPILSSVALLLVTVFGHSLFRQIEWGEMARVSLEPYDFSPHQLKSLWFLCFLSAVSSVICLSPREKTPSAILLPVAASLLVVRFSFLREYLPGFAISLACFGISLALSLLIFFRSREGWVSFSFPSLAIFHLGLLPSLSSTEFIATTGLLCLGLSLAVHRERWGAVAMACFPFWALANVAFIRPTALLAGGTVSALCLLRFLQAEEASSKRVLLLYTALILALFGVVPLFTHFTYPLFPGETANLLALSPFRWIFLSATAAGAFAVAFLLQRIHWERSLSLPFNLRKWKSVQTKWALYEKYFWIGLWWIPIQLGHSLGSFLTYWQGGPPQYTLAVLLLGASFFLWAVLRTQVF